VWPAAASSTSAGFDKSTTTSLQKPWISLLQLWFLVDWTTAIQCLPASRGQQPLHYNEYRMPQRVSSSACRHATTSVRHCWSCIGCQYTIESSSSWVFWCTWHTMDSRRCTLATPWRQSVAYHLVGDYALLTQQTTWCQGHVLSSGSEHSVSGPLVWNYLVLLSLTLVLPGWSGLS